VVLHDVNKVGEGLCEGGDRSDPHLVKDGGNCRKGKLQVFSGVTSDVVGAFQGVLSGSKNGPEMGEKMLAVFVIID